ncbi:MAG: murein biosynthesis integral membrane protein MurJ [bacterium]
MIVNSKKLSQQTWISAAFLLILIALISKILGFIREVLIARYFGISEEVDAYMVAITIYGLVGGVLGSAFSTSLIPLYQKTLNKCGMEKTKDFIKSIFTFTSITSILLMIAVFVLSKYVIKIIAPSLPESTMKLSVEMLKWLSLLVLGNALFNVLSSVYNALHHFKIPALTDLLSNLCVIITLIFFSGLWGIYALVIGLIIGIYFVVLILFFNALRLEIIGFRMNFKTEEFKNFIYFNLPILLYIFLPQLTGIIENFFASSLKQGSISTLGYAKRLSEVVSTLLAANIAKATFPTFSLLSTEKKIVQLQDIVVKLNKQIIVYFLPLSFGLVFFSKEIITLVFMRGAFDSLAVEMTSNVFKFYAAILIANMILPIYFRLCYAFSDTTTPIKAFAISIVFMIPLYYYLTPILGINGIALTSSISILLTLIFTGISVRKKIQGLSIFALGKLFARSFLCASLAILPLLKFKPTNNYEIIILIGAYFIFYFILAWFIMNKEIKRVGKSFWRIKDDPDGQ